MEEQQDIHDAVVVGAGPAGLTAAIYFGRFRRRCLVLEDGHSRARWIPTCHNIQVSWRVSEARNSSPR
jgi:thioredoxin reductase (NADPH)